MSSDDRCRSATPGTLPAAARRRHGRRPARTRLLVVETSRRSPSSLPTTWNGKAYRVATVHDGVAALDALATFRPELVVLDLLLPLKSGWQVLRQMRKHPEPAIAAAPVIVVSALGGERLERELAACGTPHVLGKRSSVLELCELVARLLDPSDRLSPPRV